MQLQFNWESKWQQCEHQHVISTLAVIPAGLWCQDCETLLQQSRPQSPQELGYVAADWAWFYVHGNRWITT